MHNTRFYASPFYHNSRSHLRILRKYICINSYANSPCQLVTTFPMAHTRIYESHKSNKRIERFTSRVQMSFLNSRCAKRVVGFSAFFHATMQPLLFVTSWCFYFIIHFFMTYFCVIFHIILYFYSISKNKIILDVSVYITYNAVICISR